MGKTKLAKKWRIRSVLGIGAALIAISAVSAERQATQQSKRVPVLLELFTSEGCSSCPPADRLLQDFDMKQPVPGAELIVLSEHVDYWNRLGWKDPFSSAQYSARQQSYNEQPGFDGVYTPQLVVDGHWALVGSDLRAANATIQRALHETKAILAIPSVERVGQELFVTVEIDGAIPRDGVLYVAVADNNASTKVHEGENGGRVLTHVAVVRVLQEAGKVGARSPVSKQVSLTLPQDMGGRGIRVVAFIQDPKSSLILGSVQRKL